MIGSFLTRGLVLVFGYAYPAYECFKTVEMNKPNIQELRFWCQYWILVAVLTVCERFGDAFVSWVPMYSEAKLAFFIYLWCPKTKGTTYVYDSFFRPVVLRHETDIDRSLLELRTRAGDMALLYWQNAASYVQTRIFDILQYIASQSTPRATQPQRQSSRGCQRTVTPPKHRSAAPTTRVQTEEQASPASTESSSENEADAIEVLKPSQPPPVAAPAASLNAQKATPSEALAQTTKASSSSETQVVQIDRVPSSDNRSAKPPVEIVMEEAVRITRARSRKTRLAPNP
ncbi:putative HVA22-like protein g [Nicotiana tabacum]|uniref:HVA22-like protein n=2 Tax=Nicotiana TaxID=4085 RepID=A0A1S4BYK1_TOBAC|nr:PREDICTED: putative HVA22-like protein g [Nicotiana sylvestris]XP_009772285.1 PREDICTED: putative HVA22-like protein g [Nicotiana sylvestris]XP_016493863.1 PREDICTED: putative HVA22-like protein g [Nicotiana tabacum]XP_016493864.1 PREDICTED: putative HVA22-like protein g [Nicotiana tabacum]